MVALVNKYSAEGLLVHASPASGRMVIDRRPMRTNNVFNRFQVLDHNEELVSLHRSRRSAIAACAVSAGDVW